LPYFTYGLIQKIAEATDPTSLLLGAQGYWWMHLVCLILIFSMVKRTSEEMTCVFQNSNFDYNDLSKASNWKIGVDKSKGGKKSILN
jgi:hypothetical protein